ncbi:2-succinyl-6-hydroxy-2,4-cyclohexadiene-1-carboxylate synthase [Propionicimonas sp. T2.31MG-18]|uniref:alpha/beta fold hydrolase n=1 Tax=Propionicimonas sp. T2.31MG-18 TaxID=3157620 RepID=UPI0035EA6C38
MPTDLADLRLHVRIDEGEGPVIVLLHGINSNADDLRGLIDALGSGHRLIAPDLLGFGDSPKPLDIEYSTDEQAQVLDQTLADLGITNRFLLFGYSLGGDIALRYAATYPEKLRRLFLLSTPFYLPPEAYDRRGFGMEYAQALLFSWLWKVVGRQKDRDTPVYELAAGRLRTFAQDFMRTGDISQHWDIMARTLQNTISQATILQDLPKLTMPTVFALGVRDPIVRPDQTLALQRIKPDLEVRRIMGLTADHLLVRSTPERVAVEVLRDEIDSLNVGLRTGTGAPLVLLPDLQETWHSCEGVAEDLAADHDVAVLDLLGFGDSPAPLTSRYTPEDHAAAVLSTAERLFGGQRFQVVGVGFGADVALACAAVAPHAVSGVVAISPLLPDQSGADPSPALARLLASRDTLMANARDERMQRIGNERLEREVVPAVRSMDALVSTPIVGVLSRMATPMRFLLPGPSSEVPGWLAARAQSEPGLVRVDSTPGISHPEFSAELVAAAVRGVPLPPLTTNPDPRRPARRDPITAKLRGLNTRLLISGGFQALLGLPLLLWPAPIPVELVAAVMAVWIGITGVQTLVGAVGLKRRHQGWLMWGIVGAFEVLFALGLLAGSLFAIRLVAWIIMIGAGVRGVALLMVAIKASRTPGRRWVLVLDALLSLAIALALLIWPLLGARLLRYSIGGYLVASGLGSIAFAYANHRATNKRIQHYLAQTA